MTDDSGLAKIRRRELAQMERDAQEHNEAVRAREECTWCDGTLPADPVFVSAGGIIEGPFCSEGCRNRWLNEPGRNSHVEVRKCPFRGCPWDYHYDPELETDVVDADRAAEQHYVDAHAGRARVQVTLEMEQQIGDRTPQEIADEAHDQFEDATSWDVAFARAEVLEAADDHDRISHDD